MTLSEFKTIARLLKQAYKELEEEALEEGIDLLSPEYKEMMDELRIKVLETHGFTLEEYRSVKEDTLNFSQEEKTILSHVEELEKTFKEKTERHIPTEEEIEAIAEKVAQKYVKPPQIINKIVDRETIKQPKIIKETVRVTERVEYNDKDIKKELETLSKKVSQYKEVDIEALKNDFKKSHDTLREALNIEWGSKMPDFRKMGMGLQAQIDDLRANRSSGGGTWGTITGTITDQTDLVTYIDAQIAADVPLIDYGTQGSVLFLDPNGRIAEDNLNFFWDNTNNRLGIGTNTPGYTLHALQGNASMYFLDNSNVPTFAINRTASSGQVRFDLSFANSPKGGININTSGEVQFFAAAGGYYPTFYSNNTERMRISSSGLMGIGTTSPDRLLHTELDSATTNAITYPFRVTSTSTGTAATGFGTGVEYEAENASGTNRIVGTHEFIYTDATNATEDTDFYMKLYTGGALQNAFRIDSIGGVHSYGGQFFSESTSLIFGLNGGTTNRLTLVTANVFGTTDLFFQGFPGGSGYAVFEATQGLGAGISTFGSLPIIFAPNRTIGATFTSAQNFKIGGTATRGTTEGTNQLALFNGTAPVGTLTNGISFYADSGEARVMDAAGNSTLLSPHDRETNEWIYWSKNTVTGQVLRIDMERLMRRLDETFGGGFIKEFTEA